jgi:hypothetical protein
MLQTRREQQLARRYKRALNALDYAEAEKILRKAKRTKEARERRMVVTEGR